MWKCVLDCYPHLLNHTPIPTSSTTPLSPPPQPHPYPHLLNHTPIPTPTPHPYPHPNTTPLSPPPQPHPYPHPNTTPLSPPQHHTPIPTSSTTPLSPAQHHTPIPTPAQHHTPIPTPTRTGMKDYCQRYGEGIYRICKNQGGPRELGGETLQTVMKSMEIKAPVSQLEERRNWRDRRLVELSKLKQRSKQQQTLPK